jgi:hypothetical protein
MPRFDEVTCGGVQALLEPYVDGELAEREAGRLRAHLERCPACAAELRLATGIRRALRDLPQLEPPPHVLERTLATVSSAGGAAGWQEPARPGSRSSAPAAMRPLARVERWPRQFALPLAAGLAAVLAAWLLFYPGDTGSRAAHPAARRLQARQPAPNPAAVALAVRQARYALAYVGRASRQAGLTVRDEVLERRVVLPATLSATRPLHPNLGFHPEPPARKGI